MTDDTHLAFAHLSERARAMAGQDPLDRISLRDYECAADIGAFQSERGKEQRLRFNILVEVQSKAATDADDVDRILSYDTLLEAINTTLAAERLNLLETLATRVATRILAHPPAVRCFVRIEKLDRGPFALGVEIVRSAPQMRGLQPLADKMPHPLVVYLSNDAVTRPDLGVLLDRLEDSGIPVVICVGPADTVPPQAGAPIPQRRIALLAIEQNAWVLAARDNRCVVVDSRTELDWAMKHAQISVWAPLKLVLGTVDGPGPGVTSGEGLAAWFASRFKAERLVLLGGQAPEDVPVRTEAWPSGALPQI
ncbi:MAG: dihydroneopterin aldolase [Rhodobacteraceae bacterium]|nr:dihydroneopterin aldolase [Paracoccaceae bacterium]